MEKDTKVRFIDCPEDVGVVLALHTLPNGDEYLWVLAETPQGNPRLISIPASGIEEVPVDPPEVGELWAYPKSNMKWRVIRVTDDSWSMVAEDDIPKLGKDKEEAMSNVTIYTHPLPEKEMGRVEE